MPIKPDDCPLVALFAMNVRRQRLSLDISQEELAERAGVHRTYIGMLERGEKNVTIYNIERLARALNVEPDVLLKNPLGHGPQTEGRAGAKRRKPTRSRLQ